MIRLRYIGKILISAAYATLFPPLAFELHIVFPILVDPTSSQFFSSQFPVWSDSDFIWLANIMLQLQVSNKRTY